MQLLNVAIVGCGVISARHIDALLHAPERARIVACCDTDTARAATAAAPAKEAGADPRITSDYAALLADPGIDAVVLCLPHHLHAEMAIAAAKAGKHILCEKPLALTPEDCDRMAAAAREAGVVLMHGENLRTSASIEAAAALIRDGKIGRIVGLQATYAHWQWDQMNTGWRARAGESGGGHLMDGGIHFIDVLRHLGGEIVAVQAMTAQFRPELGPESEDTGVLNLRYAGGHLGQLFASHASRGRAASPMLTLFGTEGCLSIEGFGGDRALVLFPHGQPPEVILAHHDWRKTFDDQMTHFLDVIQHGVPLRSTPEDGRENLRVVLAAYESARTGREVRLSDIA